MNTIQPQFSVPRLLAAILVAFIASFTWFALYCSCLNFVGAYVGNVLLGFSGVLVGGFFFHQRYRFPGSIILLVGGVALDGFFEDSDDKVYPLSVVWVALGGLAAVAWYFWLRSTKRYGNKKPMV